MKFLLNLTMMIVLTGCVHTWRIETTTGERDTYQTVTNRDGTACSVLASKVILKDADRGGAVTCLADPSGAQISVAHSNQSALGGNSLFNVGALTWKTSSNAAPVLDSIGGAAAAIIGDVGKAVAK